MMSRLVKIVFFWFIVCFLTQISCQAGKIVANLVGEYLVR